MTCCGSRRPTVLATSSGRGSLRWRTGPAGLLGPAEVRRQYPELTLDANTKELVALAVAVTKQCDGCIASRARGAAHCGATAGEMGEALGVVILMDGGPGTVYAPCAFGAVEEFAAKT